MVSHRREPNEGIRDQQGHVLVVQEYSPQRTLSKVPRGARRAVRGVPRRERHMGAPLVLPDVRATMDEYHIMVELVNTLLPEEGGNPQASYCSRFVFLGVLENGHALPRSLALLHMLMWKFVIQELMSKSQVEHYVIDAGKTSTRALRRYMTRINAQLKEVQKRILWAKPRGKKVDIKQINKKLRPVAMISETGEEIIWEDNMRRWLQATGAIDAENYPDEPPGTRPDDDIGG